jgi:hypothetical protein
MKHKALVALLAFLLVNPWVRGQTFGPDTSILEDSQVLNSGTQVFSFDVADWAFDTTTTVNGVNFSGSGYGSNFLSPYFADYLPGAAAASSMSTNFGDILAVAMVCQPVPDSATIMLDDLAPGQTYELQLFASLAGPAGSEKVSDGSFSGALAYGGDGSGTASIVETFVAGSEVENISISSDTGALLVLNAINLREDIAAAPEPSILAMLVAGGLMLVLGWSQRFRFALSMIPAR